MTTLVTHDHDLDLPDSDYFEVRHDNGAWMRFTVYDDGTFRVSCEGTLVVLPRSSNSITLSDAAKATKP